MAQDILNLEKLCRERSCIVVVNFHNGENVEIKIYSNSQMRIIAEKDGILEFTINYKVQKKNTLSGKFAVSVFTNQ